MKFSNFSALVSALLPILGEVSAMDVFPSGPTCSQVTAAHLSSMPAVSLRPQPNAEQLLRMREALLSAVRTEEAKVAQLEQARVKAIRNRLRPERSNRLREMNYHLNAVLGPRPLWKQKSSEFPEVRRAFLTRIPEIECPPSMAGCLLSAELNVASFDSSAPKPDNLATLDLRGLKDRYALAVKRTQDLQALTRIIDPTEDEKILARDREIIFAVFTKLRAEAAAADSFEQLDRARVAARNALSQAGLIEEPSFGLRIQDDLQVVQ